MYILHSAVSHQPSKTTAFRIRSDGALFFSDSVSRASKAFALRAPFSWGGIQQSSPTGTRNGWTCGGDGVKHASAICSLQIKPITKEASGTSYTVTSACPIGQRVIGGGCHMKEALTYSASYPEKHRWVCRGHGLKRVWAICTEAKCNEALSGTKGAGYRGCQTRTRSGKTCQPWSSQSPHKHTSNTSRPSTNPSAGLVSNYCRNPDGEPSIWCFTMDPNTRFELCDPVPREAGGGTNEKDDDLRRAGKIAIDGPVFPHNAAVPMGWRCQANGLGLLVSVTAYAICSDVEGQVGTDSNLARPSRNHGCEGSKYALNLRPYKYTKATASVACKKRGYRLCSK